MYILTSIIIILCCSARSTNKLVGILLHSFYYFLIYTCNLIINKSEKCNPATIFNAKSTWVKQHEIKYHKVQSFSFWIIFIWQNFVFGIFCLRKWEGVKFHFHARNLKLNRNKAVFYGANFHRFLNQAIASLNQLSCLYWIQINQFWNYAFLWVFICWNTNKLGVIVKEFIIFGVKFFTCASKDENMFFHEL